MALGKVFVFMNNPKNSYVTSVNGAINSHSAKSYFLGQFFNVSNDPDGEDFDQCVGIYHISGSGCSVFVGTCTPENLNRFDLAVEYELLTGEKVAITA